MLRPTRQAGLTHLSLIALVLALPAGAQSTLIGIVSADTAHTRPLVGIEVSIPAVHKSSRTDSSGTYRIDGLAPGHYTISIRAVGYQPRIDSLTIGADDEIRDFVLLALAQPLDTVVSESARKHEFLSPAMRGFEERKKAGFGHFIGEDVLRKNDNDKLSDIARRIPGAKTIRSGTHTYLASTRKSGLSATSTGGCFATVYMDGMLIYTQSRARAKTAIIPPPDLQDFNINELGAVEYYGGEATAPPGFHQDGCGLLLLWTRER